MKKRIAVIDDENINLTLINSLLENDYSVYPYLSGNEFLNEISIIKPNLILLDIIMPNLNGFDLLKKIREKKEYDDILVIFLTANSDEFDEAYGINLGAVDYVTKPFSPDILKERIKTHLKLQDALEQLKLRNDYLNDEVSRRVEEYKAIQDISFGILAQIVEQKDLQTSYHIFRTQSYVEIICRCLQKKEKFKQELTDDLIDKIKKASIFHDIGKVGIPDRILSKNGKLTNIEYEEMKKHVLYGKQAIEQAIKLLESSFSLSTDKISETLNFFNIAKDIAFYHHERYDGKGYLSNLKKEEIPLSARIMAVSDVFDALVSKRVYKDSWSLVDSIEYIKSQRELQFDPDVVDAFFESIEDIISVYNNNRD